MRDGQLMNETAYYYPEPYWYACEGAWIKSLLLFFDDIAILLPKYMQGLPVAVDPVLAGPLGERGLLRILQPEWFVDEDTAGKLTAIITALLEAGAFDDFDELGGFASISMARMGYNGDNPLAEETFHKLRVKGLARETQNGVTIYLRDMVRTAYLTVLALLARETGAKASTRSSSDFQLARYRKVFHGILQPRAYAITRPRRCL
jgi:hypothetical protein